MNVKIGFKIYKILFEHGIYNDEPKELYGEIDFDCEVIRISDKYNSKQQAVTLLHEILHGVDHDRSIGLTEHQVNQLGVGLFEVMLSNQNLFKETIIKEEA